MAFEYTVNLAQEHVRMIGTGPFAGREWINGIRQLAADPRYQPHFTILIDLRALKFEPSRQSEVVEVAEILAGLEAWYKNHIAIVAQGAALLAAEALAVFVRISGHISMRVFIDESAAELYCQTGHDPVRQSSAVLT